MTTSIANWVATSASSGRVHKVATIVLVPDMFTRSPLVLVPDVFTMKLKLSRSLLQGNWCRN